MTTVTYYMFELELRLVSDFS